MTQRVLLFDDLDNVGCSWCKEVIGKYPDIHLENMYQQPHYTQQLCEVIWNTDQAIEDYKTERMFDPTASE